MATQWITFAKITGPMVARVRQEMLRWTAACPPDGEEPRFVNGDLFQVKDEEANARMLRLAAAIERHAAYPPIGYFAKWVDPWTVAGALVIYSWLRGRRCRLRLACGKRIDMLLIQPESWPRFRRRLIAIRQARPGATFEEKVILSHLIQAAIAMDSLYQIHQIDRAILVVRQAVDISCTSDEHLAAARSVPEWYEG